MEYPQFFHQMPINLLFANHLYILRNFYIYIISLYIYLISIYINYIYIYNNIYLPRLGRTFQLQEPPKICGSSRTSRSRNFARSRWRHAGRVPPWPGKNGDLWQKKTLKMVMICWLYGDMLVLWSIISIWYMEIYGDMCYNSIYQPSNMFFSC